MSKTTKSLITIVFLAILGYVVYSTFTLSRHACEVCMEFEGREVCRTAWGTTEVEALRSAVDNACAQLTSGRSNLIRCGRTPPKSVDCTEGG